MVVWMQLTVAGLHFPHGQEPRGAAEPGEPDLGGPGKLETADAGM